jgi:hypothetical protein
MGDHYAYCRDLVCTGCLPTDLELLAMHPLDLGAELLRRAIPMPSGALGQIAHTEAMLAAIDHQAEWYLTVSRQLRHELVTGHDPQPWPPVPARA